MPGSTTPPARQIVYSNGLALRAVARAEAPRHVDLGLRPDRSQPPRRASAARDARRGYLIPMGGAR